MATYNGLNTAPSTNLLDLFPGSNPRPFTVTTTMPAIFEITYADTGDSVIFSSNTLDLTYNGNKPIGGTFVTIVLTVGGLPAARVNCSAQQITKFNSHDLMAKIFAGNDTLTGDDGNNSLRGFNGSDVLNGGGNNDTLVGGNGKDFFDGGENDDTLFGGKGMDLLEGGLGQDLLTGGKGADNFYFDSALDAEWAISLDFIRDFRHDQHDKIDVSAIDAIAGGVINDDFTFIGKQQFHGIAGELRYQKSGTNVLLQGDTDGDGAPEFGILVHAAKLVSADFYL